MKERTPHSNSQCVEETKGRLGDVAVASTVLALGVVFLISPELTGKAAPEYQVEGVGLMAAGFFGLVNQLKSISFKNKINKN